MRADRLSDDRIVEEFTDIGVATGLQRAHDPDSQRSLPCVFVCVDLAGQGVAYDSWVKCNLRG
jgi:hypothetical protein